MTDTSGGRHASSTSSSPPSSSPHSSFSSFPFPVRRSLHVLDTESTDAQANAEDECAPFFVDLTSLSEGQLDHLRGVGLLPPLPPIAGNGRGGRRSKASRLLGMEVDDVDDGDGSAGRPRIEPLDEATDDGSSSSSPAADDDGPDENGDGNRDGNDDDASPFDPYAIRLLRAAHSSYLSKALSDPLPRGFVSLDASHPWMVYWCLHSLDLLGQFDVEESAENGGLGSGTGLGGGYGLDDVEELQKGHLLGRIVSTLDRCWTDVPLEFSAGEVASDAKLRSLHAQQRETFDGDETAGSGKEKVSVAGGGFGGGPGQMPHCAVTYAAVLALSIVSGVGGGRPAVDGAGAERPGGHPYCGPGEAAMELLARRRLQLYAFFLTLRERGDGGDGEEEERIAFRMQHDGEVDVRASYCILAPCYLLGLLDVDDGDSKDDSDNNPLLSPAIPRHVASCQTHEGGFGAEPHNEAHGGYTFCALASLRILGAVSAIDTEALSSWLARRQMGYEGGFCGRTNKLVDGCYSFWQGGATAVLDGWRDDDDEEGVDAPTQHSSSEESTTRNELSFDEVMLQRYILLCAQDANGGLRDKPSKPRDFYHSCYNLSGLSVAQRAPEPWPLAASRPSMRAKNDNEGSSANRDGAARGEREGGLNRLFGDRSVNVVGRTDPVINIRVERVRFMLSQRRRFSP